MNNLSFTPETIEKVHFIGPLVRKKADEVKKTAKKRRVLSMVGGFGYRERLFQNILSTAELLDDFDFTLVAGPNVDAKKLPKKKNTKIIRYLPDPFPEIKSSHIVIAPGGHSTIMECLSFGKPTMSFPDMFHSEQQNNARRLDELKVGRCLSYFTPPIVIADSLTEMTSDNTMAKNCRKMMRLSRQLDGPKALAYLIEDRG